MTELLPTLTELPDVSEQPAYDTPDPTFGESFSAGWTSDAIRTDSRLYAEQVRADIRRDMIDLLPAESRARFAAFENANLRDEQAVWQTLFDEAAQVREGQDAWADLPGSLEERDAMVDARRRQELDEAEAVLSAGSGFAGFLGQTASAVADPFNLALAPIGTGGTLLRFTAKEAALGAFAEALVLPSEYRVADELGIDDPNALQRIGIGAAASGAFAFGAGGIARFLGYREAKSAAADAGRPAGVNRADHRADVEAAREELETGIAPPPGAADAGAGQLTPDPPGWDRIEAGIFAGESQGDWNALYGFSNRDGGPFADVRVTEMTVDEAIRFSSPNGPYAQWVKGRIGRVATPMGAFQIVGTTLRAAKRGLGLRGDEMMTPTLQRELGKYIFRTQGTDAWVGYRGPRTPMEIPGEFGPYRTSRGYTGTGQVMVGDDMRIDVEYQVVDLSLLRQASGDLQPRDRARAASDAWVSDTAARLDPALLMPSPTADRGAPIVGSDWMIESGNGRVRAIERAYAQHPDRADAYRQQIEAAGYTIPEGVSQPVLIARRSTELDPADRRKLVVDAQDSGVARMTATERGRIGSRALTADLMARLDRGQKLSSAANRDFARRFAGAFPRSERNAFINERGRVSTDGIRQIQDALFARAWEAPDIVARAVEAEPGQLKSLLDALADAAPEFAALRADIEAGLVRPEMDITPWVLDAARMIIAARDAAGQGQAVADLLQEFLSEVDLLDGAVAPLTQALVRAMMPGGRQAPAKSIAAFLKRYADEARKTGRVGDVLGDARGPLDVLKRIDPEHFGELTETGMARIREPEPARIDAEAMPEGAFADGAMSPEAEAAGDLAAAELRAATGEGPFGPILEGYEGDWRGAVAELTRRETGEAPGALSHPEVGPIALVWGREGTGARNTGLGLAKILRRHGEVLDDLQGRLDQATGIDRLGENRIVLSGDGGTFVISRNWNGDERAPWLLTAYESAQDGGRSIGRAAALPEGSPSPSAPARTIDNVSAAADQGDPSSEIREIVEAWQAAGGDMEVKVPGAAYTVRDVLDDLDADDALATVVDLCAMGRAG